MTEVRLLFLILGGGGGILPGKNFWLAPRSDRPVIAGLRDFFAGRSP